MKLLATILALSLVAAVAGAFAAELGGTAAGLAVTPFVAVGLSWLFRETLA